MQIKAVATPATALIAICGKCSKKLGGGFGASGNTSLAKALATALHLPKPKRAKVRIVETKCLKLCPKAAVAVISSHDPGHVLVIPKDTSVTAIIHRLDLRFSAGTD